MSDEKMYTKREMVLAQQAAFVHGVQRFHVQPEVPFGQEIGRAVDRVERMATAIYQLPKVTRPRVVIMQDQAWSAREWKYVGGNLMSRMVSNYPAPWTSTAQITPTPENVKTLADLLANPTETVEAEP